MSMRYRGGYISATLPTVATSAAPGAWTIAQQMQYQAAGSWPSQPFLGWATGGIPGTNSDQTGNPAFDSAGNVYMSMASGSGLIRVAKFSSAGVKAWEKTYFIPTAWSAASYFLSGYPLSSGDMVFFGLVYTAYYPITVVMRITSAGAVVACRTFEGAGTTYPAGMYVDSADNIYISYSYNGYVSLAKLNPSTLSAVWTKWTAGSATYSNVTVSPDNSAIYLTGYYNSAGFVHKYDASGNLNVSAAVIAAGSGATVTSVGGVSADSLGNVFYTLTANDGYSYVVKSNSALTTYSWAYRTANNNVGNSYQYSAADGAGGAFFGNSLGYASTLGLYSVNIGYFSSSGSSLFSNSIVGKYLYQRFSVDTAQQAIYVSSTNTGGSGANAGTIIQKLPFTGSGLGIYQGGSSYFPYGGGASFSSSTISLNTYTPPTTTYSITETSRSPIVTDQTTTWTTTAFAYPLANGSALYSMPGTYTWIAPAGVTSASVLCIGGGGGGGGSGAGYSGGGGGGAGGGLAYKNDISVTPGSGYTVVVGAGGAGGAVNAAGAAGTDSYFVNASTLLAYGGYGGGTWSGVGGTGRSGSGTGATYYYGGSGGQGYTFGGGGGGGTAGYAGNGGSGGGASANVPGVNGSGGGGAGGNSGPSGGGYGYNIWYSGSVGGNVGILGQGNNGVAPSGIGSPTDPLNFGAGGGGGGAEETWNGCCYCCYVFRHSSGTAGRSGAVRILWGSGRSFPSTNVSVP